MTTFGERYLAALEYWRDNGAGADATETAFAGAVGIPMSSLSPYKNSVNPPIYRVVLRLAKAAGVDPGWLMFGDDSAAPQPGYRVTDYEPIADPTDAELGILGTLQTRPFVDEDAEEEAS